MIRMFLESSDCMDTERYVNLNSIERVKNFVNQIINIDSDVDLIYGRYTLDAKSIMAIFSINLNNKLKLVLHSDDEEEIRRFNEIAEEYK